MTWKDDRFDNVLDLFKRLLDLGSKENPIACRGQADNNWSLPTSLGRLLDPNSDYKIRLAEEAAIIEKFRVRAREFFGQTDVTRLDASLKNNKISSLTIMQHFRAPTRLLDWTLSPWIALYFTAIEHHERDGAIWWFKQREFEYEVGRRWAEQYKMKRYPERGGEVDLNDTAFNPDGPSWITKLHCMIQFPRIEVQQAFFTVAGRLGLDHADRIADVLGYEQYGRIIVPGSWKQDILDRLRVMNIHSRSLDYPGADIVGNALMRELEEARRRAAAH
jgi:hypothetical protein